MNKNARNLSKITFIIKKMNSESFSNTSSISSLLPKAPLGIGNKQELE